MKEYPILFSAEMVRAILVGCKTQTRRIPTPYNSTIDGPTCNLELWKTLVWDLAVMDPGPSPAGNPGPYWKVPSTQGTTHRVYCRYQVGDILWVKETIAIETWVPEYGKPEIPVDRPHRYHQGGKNEFDEEYWEWPHYQATDPEPDLMYDPGREGCKGCEDGEPHAHWTPSIHMPRWASRMALPVFSVRSERIQDIKPLDARGEGAISWVCEDYQNRSYALDGRAAGIPYMVSAFSELWDSINAKRGYAWETNPPVWVIEFQRVAA